MFLKFLAMYFADHAYKCHTTRPITRVCSVCNAYRYLYYTDWGTTASVVKTHLDGSSPRVIKQGLDNPNGIVVTSNKIYVTDSHYKTRVPDNARDVKYGSLYSMDLDGNGWINVLSGTQLKVCTKRFFVLCRINTIVWKSRA